jgi:zinc transporter ZupT
MVRSLRLVHTNLTAIYFTILLTLASDLGLLHYFAKTRPGVPIALYLFPMRDRVERIESLKAGSLGGIAAGVAYGLTIVLDRSIWPEPSKSLLSLSLEATISIVGGFLFGVTYRYIIRTDRNDHLNSGAVLAFGLVRGLAQVDVDEFDLSQVWMDGLIVANSIFMFAIARYAIDYALTANWVLPFTQQELSELTKLDLVEPTLHDRDFAATSINRLGLTPRDRLVFAEALLNPDPPSERAIADARWYAQMTSKQESDDC